MVAVWFVVLLMVTSIGIGISSLDVTAKCCEFADDPSHLMACVEDAAAVSFTDDKSATIFATVVSPQVYTYAANNLLFNLGFIHKRGHSFKILSASTGDDYYPIDRRWNKIYATAFALNTWAKDKKYLVMLDADLVILDSNFNIQSITDQYPHADLILAQDSIDIANTGFMIVKNSRWSIGFFEKWWASKGMHNTFCDQHVLNKLITELRSTRDSSKVEVIPYQTINSRFPAIENFRDSDPILHLMGETNDVRNVVSQYISQQHCLSEAQSRDRTCNTGAASGDASCAADHRLRLTQTKLRELKQASMTAQWQLHKEKCMSDSASERDFALLHESIGHMCAPTKRIDSSNALIDTCMTMMQEAHAVNIQALAAVEGKQGSSSARLVHLTQISMLLFDMFELAGAKAAQQVSVKDDWQAILEAAQRVLTSLDHITSALDMEVAHNRAYIHHKRGIVFGSLSQHHQQYKQFEQSVDKEMIAVSEFSSALELTPQNEPEFSGFVLAYVHAASRLAEAYRQLRRLEEAQEWANIALNNIKILYASSSNEERLMRAELTNLHALCASIAADKKDWNLHSHHSKEIDKLARV